MFNVRKFMPCDIDGCGRSLYDSFFDCPLTENDRQLLRDYARVLAEKCSFTYVAEQDGQVVGFISGHYKKSFNKALAKSRDVKPHYGVWIKCFLKFAFGGYKLSAPFKEQFAAFFRQAKENGKDTPLDCDCELVALCSCKDYRKGLGTALWNAFAERCRRDGAKTVRLFTNTSATYTFYEKHGFMRIWEKPFSFGEEGSSYVYEYKFK